MCEAVESKPYYFGHEARYEGSGEQVETNSKLPEALVEELFGSPLPKHSKWIIQLFKRMENGEESTRLTKKDQVEELEAQFKS